MSENPFLREQTLDINDLIPFPPIVESAASLRPLEKTLIGYFITLIRPRVIVELGVYKAVTTKFVCDFLDTNDIECQVIGFDLPEMIDAIRAENGDMYQREQSGRLQLIPGKLPHSLKDWLETNNTPIDLALVDARHDYPSVTSELKLLWTHLAPFGAVLGHDYSGGEHEGVMYAFDWFALRHLDAQVMSLRSTPEANQFAFRGNQQEMYHSVLVALRRRPYRFSLMRLFHHMRMRLQS